MLAEDVHEAIADKELVQETVAHMVTRISATTTNVKLIRMAVEELYPNDVRKT